MTHQIHVVHVRDIKRKLITKDPQVFYIGRTFTLSGWNLKASPLANPQRLINGTSRAESILAFEDRLSKVAPLSKGNHPQFWAILAAHELRLMSEALKNGDVYLGCWCAPEACHGEVIAKHIMQLMSDSEEQP